MNILKRILIIIFSLISVFFLIIIYDLSSYDSSYLNRSAFTVNPNNLNSKKIKKIYGNLEKYYYKLNYTFFDSHKKNWEVEDFEKRKNLPNTTIISGKKENFSLGTNIEDIEKNYSNWMRSHGGYSSAKFSELKKISKSNVKDLEVAWIFKSNDIKKSIQANPVVYEGLVYFPTPGNYIVCLDGANGEIVWKYKVEKGLAAAKRGLLLWKDKKNDSLTIFFTNNDQLISLNAKTGEPNASFGKNGIIKIGSAPTTPTIIDDNLVIGSIRPSIEVYDVYNGNLKWKYYLRETNFNFLNLGDFKGGTPWGGISSDNKKGILYLTTGNAEPYLVGVKRPGKNLFTNSVIAFDIRNKKLLWYFQETCHDLWNYDIASPPILTTINKYGKRIDVVVAVTKLGNTIILDRITGELIFDFEKKLAPTSKFPGEKTCEYQPSVKIPEPFARSEFNLDQVTNKTEKDREYILEQLKSSNYGFFPTYEINKPTITYGVWGGAQWPGASVDPYKNILYVTSNNFPHKWEVYSSFNINKNLEFKTNYYDMKSNQLKDLEGYPGVTPPWGTLTALNLNSGKIIWQVPLGYFEELKKRGFQDTGTLNFGGATATAGGVVFAAGTIDKLIRAFDADTGKILWEYKLPYIGSAPPTIYEANGEQYVIIPATGGLVLSFAYPELVEQGDTFVAFKLKK